MIITKYVHTTRPTRIIIRVYVRDIADTVTGYLL